MSSNKNSIYGGVKPSFIWYLPILLIAITIPYLLDHLNTTQIFYQRAQISNSSNEATESRNKNMQIENYLLRYNNFLDCFSELFPPRNCDSNAKKSAVDLNKDGYVNTLDYNLFLRELSGQIGQ